MKVWEQRLVPIGFALAGVLFLVPALKSIVKGQPLNAAFLGIAAACLVLGLVLWLKSGGGSGSPSG